MRRMKLKAAPNVAHRSRGTPKEQSVCTTSRNSSENSFVDRKNNTGDNCHDKGELKSSKFIKTESLNDEVIKNNDDTYSGITGTDFHKKSSEYLLNDLEKQNTETSSTEKFKFTENEEHSKIVDVNSIMRDKLDLNNEKKYMSDESKVMGGDNRPDLCPQILFQSSSSSSEKNNAKVTLSDKRQEISRRKKIKVTPVFSKIKKENVKSCSEIMNESIDKDIKVIPASVSKKTEDADLNVEQTAAIKNKLAFKEKTEIEIPFVEKVSESVKKIQFDESLLKESFPPPKKGSTRRSKIRTMPTLSTNKKNIKLEKETKASNREDESTDSNSKKEIQKSKFDEGLLKSEYRNCSNKSNDSSIKDTDNLVSGELNLKGSEKTFKSDKSMDINSKENISTIEGVTSKDEILRDFEEGRICQNLEEDEVITVFRERKNEYHKKIREGTLERKEKMTMFDLIFYNPQNNPMSGPSKDKRKNSPNDNGNEGEINEIQREEEMVDDFGLEGINNEDNQNKDVNAHESEGITNPSEENKEDDIKPNNGIESDCDDNVLGPKLKIGPDGEIIIDEQSLVIKTTAAKEKDLIMSNSVLVEEDNDNIHYGRHNKKRRRSCEWTIKETARFYKALSTVGTDFSLMESLFTWRSRAELKTKFKKEERKCRKLVERALQDDKQFDFTIFDESDYDPEEDRKSVKIEEKKEAKRKKKEKKENNIKMCEKKKKKKAVAEIKSRKAVLRKVFKNKGKTTGKKKEPRKYKKKENKSEDSLNLMDEEDMDCGKKNKKSLKISKEFFSKRKVKYRKKSRVIISDSSSNEDESVNEDNKKERQMIVDEIPCLNKISSSDDFIPANNTIVTDDADQWIEQEINSPMPSRDTVDLISKNLLFKVDVDCAKRRSSVIDQDEQLTSNDCMENLNKECLFNISNDSISEHVGIDEDIIPNSNNIMHEEAVMETDCGKNETMKGLSGNDVTDCDSLLQSCVIDKGCNENVLGDIPPEYISESLPSDSRKNKNSLKSSEIIETRDNISEDKTIDSLRNNLLKTTLVEKSNNVSLADDTTYCEKEKKGENETKEKTNLKETNLKKTEGEKTFIKEETDNIKDTKYKSSHDSGNKPHKASVWHPQKFPVSAIITDLEGKSHIKVTTEQGSFKHVPVPRLPSGTSNIVVVASISTQGTEVYHVFAVAPPCNNE